MYDYIMTLLLFYPVEYMFHRMDFAFHPMEQKAYRQEQTLIPSYIIFVKQ